MVNADGNPVHAGGELFGADSFTYKVNDGTADFGTVTVVVTVNGVNDAPVAAADSYATDEDTSLQVGGPVRWATTLTRTTILGARSSLVRRTAA